jgi:S1-C subfamily serine protease
MYAQASICRREPRDGEAIAVSGYPLEHPALITTSGIVASAFSIDVAEREDPACPRMTIPDVADAYVADVAANPGNSGGPVYLEESGEVISVCVSFRIATAEAEGVDPFSYNSGLTTVVPFRYAAEVLARH